MSVLGRSKVSSPVQHLTAVFETDITSSNVGEVAFFNTTTSNFELLTTLDTEQLTGSLVGVISDVTLDGDGLGATGTGYVTLKGSVQKAGAISGQVYFLPATGATLSITPPVGDVAIRAGYSTRNEFIYVEIDPTAISVAILSDKIDALETQVGVMQTTVDSLAAEIISAPVYDWSSGDSWGVNTEATNTDFGLDDSWTEGTLEYNTDFGGDDEWAVLTITE